MHVERSEANLAASREADSRSSYRCKKGTKKANAYPGSHLRQLVRNWAPLVPDRVLRHCCFVSEKQRIGGLDSMVSTIRRIQQQPDELLRQSLAESAREVVNDYFERGEITLAARCMLHRMLDDVSADEASGTDGMP